jgi:hypothetical protein
VGRSRDAVPCALASVSREEPLLGTASRVRRWLVLEQPGPWGREALTESRLDHALAQTLRAQGRRHGARVVLVRRPGWETGEQRRVYLARTTPGSAWIRQLDLDDDDDLLHLDLGVLGRPEPPPIGAPGPPGVHLVCTNGRHDACCADFGRPVVRALRAGGCAEVWESSHIGGDRFAANIACLPSGVFFGRVQPEGACRLLEDLAGGVIDLDRYRGRSCYPPLVQAAETFARRHLDERRLDALEVVASTATGDDARTVVLRHAGDRHLEVRVVRERGDPAHLTCSGGGTSVPWRYRLVDLR